MSIKGFSVSGVTDRYDYNYLDNKPEIHSIPTGGTAGQVLAKRSGADYAVEWADQTGGGDITVDDVLSNTSENPVQNKVITAALATKADQAGIQQVIEDEVDDWLSVQAPSIGTLSYAAKQALLACFRHVAWIDDQGQSYYNALESELLPDATLESITAVFTQGSAVVCDSDPLSTLRQYLVVSATYSDSTTAVVNDYTLSGTLEVGTSTIVANYGGKTASFSVTVSSGIVTDGLVAYWDGANNTENGHDSTATTWEDLSGNYDLTKVGTDSLWTNNSLQLTGDADNGYSIANSWDYSADTTIEIVLKPTATSTQVIARFDVDPNYVTVGSKHAHNCRIFALYSDNTIGFIGNSGKTYSNPASAHTNIRKLVAVYSGFAVSKALANNTALSLSSNTHSLRESSYMTDVQIGTNLAADVSNQYPFAGDIYAVRVYNRALSDAEITKNFNSDNVKYALGL